MFIQLISANEMYFILWVYFQALIFKATILLFCAVFSGKMGHKMTTPLSFQQKRQWSHRKWTIATWQSQHDGHGGSSVRYLRFFCILFSCNFWFLEGNFPGAPQSVRKRKKVWLLNWSGKKFFWVLSAAVLFISYLWFTESVLQCFTSTSTPKVVEQSLISSQPIYRPPSTVCWKCQISRFQPAPTIILTCSCAQTTRLLSHTPAAQHSQHSTASQD